MVDKPQKVASVMLIKKRISDFQGAAKSLIDKLSDHQKRLEKLEKDKDAVHLRRETMQAIGTLKKLDLLNKDLHDFKALVVPNDPNEAKSLLNMISTLETQIDDAKNSFSQYVDHGVLSNSVIPVDEQVPKSELNSIPNDNQTLINVQKQEDDLRTRKLMCESYLQLQRNLQDLNETFLSFTDLVRAQGETVDTIESNVENTLAEVNMGVAELSKAAKIKKAMIPVTCAMLSSCVGGPVGAIFGLKVAVGTALASAFLGYGGAKLIQKKTDTSSKETKDD